MPPLQMKRDATPDFLKPSLCDSCRNSMIVEGIGLSERHVKCYSLEKLVTFKVIKCSQYDNKGQPSLYDMREAAFILMTNKGKVERSIGFISPQEYRKKKEESPEIDEPLSVPPGLPE